MESLLLTKFLKTTNNTPKYLLDDKEKVVIEEKRVLLFFPLIFSLMLTRDCPAWKNLFHFFLSGPLLHKRSQLHRFLLRPGGINAGSLYQCLEQIAIKPENKLGTGIGRMDLFFGVKMPKTPSDGVVV